jgi:hypothetical protein
LGRAEESCRGSRKIAGNSPVRRVTGFDFQFASISIFPFCSPSSEQLGWRYGESALSNLFPCDSGPSRPKTSMQNSQLSFRRLQHGIIAHENTPSLR